MSDLLLFTTHQSVRYERFATLAGLPLRQKHNLAPLSTDSANASVALKPCLLRNYVRVMITSDVAGCGCPLPETDGFGQRSGGEWGAFTLFACIMKADRARMYQVNLLLRYETLVVIFFVDNNSM